MTNDDFESRRYPQPRIEDIVITRVVSCVVIVSFVSVELVTKTVYRGRRQRHERHYVVMVVATDGHYWALQDLLY